MKRPLTQAEAESILKPGDYVHCFMNPGAILLGADWSREKALTEIARGPCQLAGPQAMALGHGLVVGKSPHYRFFETIENPEQILCVNQTAS